MQGLGLVFAGGYINCCYSGVYLVAALIKLTGILPATAFNLAIPLLAALTFSGAFSLVAGLTRRAWAGVAGGVGLVMVRHLGRLQQGWAQVQAASAHLPVPALDYRRRRPAIPH